MTATNHEFYYRQHMAANWNGQKGYIKPNGTLSSAADDPPLSSHHEKFGLYPPFLLGGVSTGTPFGSRASKKTGPWPL